MLAKLPWHTMEHIASRDATIRVSSPALQLFEVAHKFPSAFRVSVTSVISGEVGTNILKSEYNRRSPASEQRSISKKEKLAQ